MTMAAALGFLGIGLRIAFAVMLLWLLYRIGSKIGKQ